MVMRTTLVARFPLPLTLAPFLLILTLVGCNRLASLAPTSASEPQEAATEPEVKAEEGRPEVKINPRFTQSFSEATRQDPPADWPRLAEVTSAGKSVGKVYTDVVRLWKEIPFFTPEGKRIHYSATLETDLGNLEITLNSEIAPNHVRNFVALARAGYYDGLVFERIIHQVSNVDKGGTLDLIEGGGPLALSDPTYDSVGYWLKPEFDPKGLHEEGTVGAARSEEVDTASCKFYIIVSKPPETLNGNYTVFGKITHGLDVARKIHQAPAIEEEGASFSKPVTPVVIRKVIIHTREVDETGAKGE